MSKCTNNCGKCYICKIIIFKNKCDDNTLNLMYRENDLDTPDLNDLDWSKESPILHNNIFSDNNETQTVVLSADDSQANSDALVSQNIVHLQFPEEENHYHIFHQPPLDEPFNPPEISTNQGKAPAALLKKQDNQQVEEAVAI